MPFNSYVHHPLFRRTLVDVVAAAFAAVFLVVSPVTPFLIVPITVLLVAEAATGFCTTVDVLLSLVWLTLLVLLFVAGGFVAVPAAARRVLVAVTVPDEDELVFDVVVVFLVAVARVDLAFSTMLANRLDDTVGLTTFTGDAGRAICDFAGDARSRGACRALEEVGDKT